MNMIFLRCQALVLDFSIIFHLSFDRFGSVSLFTIFVFTLVIIYFFCALQLFIILKMSGVWKYFRKDEDQNKAICGVMNDENQPCGAILSRSGGSTKSMIGHLQRIHQIDIALDKQQDEKKTAPITQFFSSRKTAGEIFARVAAVDGMSLKSIVSSQCVAVQLKEHKLVVVKSPTTVRKEIINFAVLIRDRYKKLFTKMANDGLRFSLSTDEWTNTMTMRRYINVSILTDSRVFKLGLYVSFILLFLF